VITRDAVIEFIEEHRMQVLAGAAAVLAACLIALIVMMSSSRARDAQRQKKIDEMKRMALDADSLFMGGEPIGVSGVLLSRERKAAWNAEDAKRWYTVPDASSMERLRSAGSDRIDALLESVP
jgi:hypothetical protein